MHQGTHNHRAVDPAIESIATQIVDAAITVHRALGPGLLESVYEECLMHELVKRRLKVSRQVRVPIIYDGKRVAADLKLDLLVGDSVVIEVKAVETMHPVFEAQLLTYLKLSGHRLGFLLNFNVPLMKDGITRKVL